MHTLVDAGLLSVAGQCRPHVPGVHRLAEVVGAVGGEDRLATAEAQRRAAVHPPAEQVAACRVDADGHGLAALAIADSQRAAVHVPRHEVEGLLHTEPGAVHDGDERPQAQATGAPGGHGGEQPGRLGAGQGLGREAEALVGRRRCSCHRN